MKSDQTTKKLGEVCEILDSRRIPITRKYVIEYRWQKRDTNTAGTYIGQFKIVFSGDLSMGGMTFPVGEMVVPIAEDLFIVISDSGIKT